MLFYLISFSPTCNLAGGMSPPPKKKKKKKKNSMNLQPSGIGHQYIMTFCFNHQASKSNTVSFKIAHLC